MWVLHVTRSLSTIYCIALLILIVANINIFTFSFDVSSKFGLRFIATISLGSMSLNLLKLTSFSVLPYQFWVFLIISQNSIKTPFSVTWSSNVDCIFFILKISRMQSSFTFRITLNVFLASMCWLIIDLLGLSTAYQRLLLSWFYLHIETFYWRCFRGY